MRRMSVILVLPLSATVWPALGRAAAPAPMPAAALQGLEADFDGDGFADLAIGVAGENLDAVGNPGAVQVLYGTAADG